MLKRLLFALWLWSFLWAGECIQLCIAHTNDIHGALFPSCDLFDPGQPKPVYGGLSRIAALIKSLRQNNRYLLVLDAGDFYYGSPEGNKTKGLVMIKIMNAVGYDALTIGNHDLAFGQKNLEDLARSAKFPFLSANLYCAPEFVHPEFIKPFTIKQFERLRIGIVGLTTVTTERLATAKQLIGLNFVPEDRALEKYLKELKQAGAQMIILLSHLGSKKDMEIAQKFPIIDLIIGGHDHIVIEPAKKIGNKTYVVQAGTKGQRLGILDIKYDLDAECISTLTSTIRNITPSLPVDPQVESLIQKEIIKEMDEIIAYNHRYLNMEELGFWITEILRQGLNTDVAFIPSGTIRDELPEGQISRRAIHSIVPFEDRLFTFDIDTGRLKDIIEDELAFWNTKFPLAGVRVFFDPTYAAGGKVGSIELSSPRPIIKVVTSDYMIQQKRLTTWDGIYNIEPTDWTIYELIVQHLTRYPDIKYVSQNNYIVQAARPKKSGRVNINTADQRELVSLPLIGPTLAKRIIEYRTRNGPFRSTADLRKVNGIGERQINRIKDLIEF